MIVLSVFEALKYSFMLHSKKLNNVWNKNDQLCHLEKAENFDYYDTNRANCFAEHSIFIHLLHHWIRLDWLNLSLITNYIIYSQIRCYFILVENAIKKLTRKQHSKLLWWRESIANKQRHNIVHIFIFTPKGTYYISSTMLIHFEYSSKEHWRNVSTLPSKHKLGNNLIILWLSTNRI